MLTLGNLVGVILPMIGIVVHLNTFHMNFYSTQYYSLKMLFIATISLKIPIILKLFSLFTPTLFIIDAIFFLFS